MNNWENGRPKDWIGNPDYCGTCIHDANCTRCIKSFENGASNMLKAVIEKINLTEVIKALTQAIDDAKNDLEIGGGCDHSVGICACAEIENLERMEKLLPELQQCYAAWKGEK